MVYLIAVIIIILLITVIYVLKSRILHEILDYKKYSNMLYTKVQGYSDIDFDEIAKRYASTILPMMIGYRQEKKRLRREILSTKCKFIRLLACRLYCKIPDISYVIYAEYLSLDEEPYIVSKKYSYLELSKLAEIHTYI